MIICIHIVSFIFKYFKLVLLCGPWAEILRYRQSRLILDTKYLMEGLKIFSATKTLRLRSYRTVQKDWFLTRNAGGVIHSMDSDGYNCISCKQGKLLKTLLAKI